MSQFNNMSVEQIVGRIEEYKADGLAAIKNICVALKELKVRKQRHPLHRDRVYKWFLEVADGRLHPGVVALFNGRKGYLDHLVGRPLDVQKQILAERDLDVVQWDGRKRQIVEVRKPAIKLSLKDFQRVFPKGKPLPTLSEQRAALEVEIAAQPVTHTQHGPIVRATHNGKALLVGRTEVPMNTIINALREMGATVTLPSEKL